jgi:hypothetical protein
MIKKTKKIWKIVIALVSLVVFVGLAFGTAFANNPVQGATGGSSPVETGPGNENEAAAPSAEDKSTASPEETASQPDNTDEYIYIPLDSEGYYDFAQLNETTPTGMLSEFVYGLVKNLKYILGAIAVLFITLAAIKLIVAGDNEETVTKQKTAIAMGIIGLAIVMMSDEFAKVLSVACAPGEVDCARGGFLSDPGNMIQQAALFKRGTRILITFIKYFIGSIAVIMLVRNGIRFIALSGNEESVTLDKKNVAFTSLGLILIIIASTVIDKVLYIVDITRYDSSTGVMPAVNPDRGMQELVGITNLVVNFAAPIAIFALIAGAVMYATAGGNEEQTERAKRLVILAIGGMVLIYGAFAIISTVVSGQFIP